MKFEKIVIVGVGGTGSFLMPIIMRYLNSVATENLEITIIDGDKYEQNNIGRQEFAHSLSGTNKAEAQAMVYRQKFPSLKINSVNDFLGESNINIIEDGSVIFCCVDNHVCRHLLSRHCQTLNNVLLISSGNELTDGNVQPYVKIGGKEMNLPIENRHPEIATTQDGDRSEMSCEELSQLPSGGQVIFANAMSGTLMACLFFSFVSEEKTWEINDIFFDVKQVKTVRIINGTYE